MENKTDNPLKVELIVRDGCNFSFRTLRSLLHTQKQLPGMEINVVEITDSDEHKHSLGGITPSIWVNDELWFMGSFSADKFLAKVETLA